MKQYLSPEQTAKLIELGFKKSPKKGFLFQSNIGDCHTDLMLAEENYSIGELIELIPPIFTNKYNCDCYLNITHDSANWTVDYTVSGVERPYIIVGEIEFIDALFTMILKLYETGFYDFETKRYVY